MIRQRAFCLRNRNTPSLRHSTDHDLRYDLPPGHPCCQGTGRLCPGRPGSGPARTPRLQLRPPARTQLLPVEGKLGSVRREVVPLPAAADRALPIGTACLLPWPDRKQLVSKELPEWTPTHLIYGYSFPKAPISLTPHRLSFGALGGTTRAQEQSRHCPCPPCILPGRRGSGGGPQPASCPTRAGAPGTKTVGPAPAPTTTWPGVLA